MDILWKFPTRIYSLFDLRKGEERNVILILIFSFFQFFSVALFFITANAIFLSNHSIGELPYVFIATGIVLFALSFITRHVEKIFSQRQVILGEAFLLLAIVLLLRFGFISNEVSWLGYALVVSHRVMADFVSDGFNKLALLLFDVRQGKRLFGLISSSEIPANIFGYLAASSLVPFIGTANLLYISGAGLLIALLFLFVIVNVNKTMDHKEGHDETERRSDEAENAFVTRLFKSRFMFTLSVTVFLSVTAFCIIEFTFLSHVDARHKDQIEIVRFIAIILGIGQLVAFFIKTFLYSSIQRKFGVRITLFVLPFVLGLISLSALIEGLLSESASLLVWTWVVMMLANETLRSSLYNTSFLSLLQPLARKEKMQGQNALANTETSAILFSGVLLLVTYTESGSIDQYAIILLALVAIWVFFIPKINKQYLGTLEEMLKRRFVEGGAVEVNDPQALSILHKKLQSQHPGEVLYAADLLCKDEDQESIRILEQLLAHPLPEVRREIYSRIEMEKALPLQHEVKTRITAEPLSDIKKLAIQTYCFLGEESAVDEISNLIDSDDEEIQAGALVGLIRYGGINGIILAGQRLMECIHSPDPKKRAFGALVIGEVGIHNFYHPLLKLVNDDVLVVRSEAIKAAGKIKHQRLIECMIRALFAPQIFQVAINSLIKTGEDVIDVLEPEFWARERNPMYQRRIIFVCGRIGGQKSIDFLKDKLYYYQTEVRNEILYSCAKCRYKPTQHEKKGIVKVIHAELADAAWFLNSIEVLSVTSRLLEKSDIELLIRALWIEIFYVKKRLLYLLSFLYETYDIINVWESLQVKDRAKIANALEIIDVVAQKELSSLILPLLEDFPVSQQLKILNPRYKVRRMNTDEYLLALISGNDCPSVIAWTQAVAAYCVRQVKVKSLLDELEFAKTGKNILLAETAGFLLAEIESDRESADDNTAYINNGNTMTMLMESKLLTIEKVMALKTTEIFRETAEDLLVDVAHILKEASYRKNEVIVHKNEVGTCMFIIYSGSVKVHDGDLTFAILKSRDFFGELSLLDTEPRSASVTALEDSLLLRIDQQAFYEIMADRSEVIREIMKILCRRLRKQNQEVAKLNALLDAQGKPA
ncbi:MAG: MFS transporter [Cyclobacteriaceae bacterium]